jgi:hypothetical protein
VQGDVCREVPCCVCVVGSSSHLLVSATAANVVGALFVAVVDDFSSLSPFEVVGMEERVEQNDHVHKGSGAQVHEESDKVLESLEVVSWQPEANAEGVNLEQSNSQPPAQ